MVCSENNYDWGKKRYDKEIDWWPELFQKDAQHMPAGHLRHNFHPDGIFYQRYADSLSKICTTARKRIWKRAPAP